MTGSRATPLNAETLATWLADRHDIWPVRLMSARQLSSLASERGIRLNEGAILRLWQVGLLRADLVASTKSLRRTGLVRVGQATRDGYLYADARRLRRRKLGWINAAVRLPRLPKGLRPLFHPFRFYVLWHLKWQLQVSISLTQPIDRRESYGRLVDDCLASLESWSATAEAVHLVDEWHAVTEVAVATDPYTHEQVFGTFRWPAGRDQSAQRNQIAQHWRDVVEVYRQAGLDWVEEARQEVCLAAERLDPNKEIHLLLHLANPEARRRLRGNLGGAMLLLSMAETLRRAAESVFERPLREEDEHGFGMPSVAKEQAYGSPRVLDGDRGVARELMRSLGLDYGVRTRWYVEGETEYYALLGILADPGPCGIELINLAGQVAQRRGRGVAFRENLLEDLRQNVFSLVSIDGDRDDFIRAVMKAAEDDELCGSFFFSVPDFELHNFTRDELAAVLWDAVAEAEVKPSERLQLHAAIRGARSAKELLREAARAVPAVAQVDKGPDWGRRLMRYALDHPNKPDGTLRPVIEAVRIALFGDWADYRLTRARYRVDPNTGRLIERL